MILKFAIFKSEYSLIFLFYWYMQLMLNFQF